MPESNRVTESNVMNGNTEYLMTADEFNNTLSSEHEGKIHIIPQPGELKGPFNADRDNRHAYDGKVPGDEAGDVVITPSDLETYQRECKNNGSWFWSSNIGKYYRRPSSAGKFDDYLDTPYEDTTEMNHIRGIYGIDRTDMQSDKLLWAQMGAYNRFKVPTLNNQLSKCFPHVFFVRPNCNIFDDEGKIHKHVLADPFFYYMYQRDEHLLWLLCQNQLVYDPGHHFNLLLSTAKTFQCSDEYINASTYGTTVNGHKISYGQSNIESQVANEFNIEYTDDSDFNIYYFHKAWAEYTSNVYTGRFEPRNESIFNKEIDYATSCYYFLCGEDGETILFWTKYYGVFPITIPSSHLSAQNGQILSIPNIDIKYHYSWKKDTDPLSLLEFNMNAFQLDDKDENWSASYTPSFDPTFGRSAPTWVGPPFVELCHDDISGVYKYKLRFRSFPDLANINLGTSSITDSTLPDDVVLDV